MVKTGTFFVDISKYNFKMSKLYFELLSNDKSQTDKHKTKKTYRYYGNKMQNQTNKNDAFAYLDKKYKKSLY